MMAEISLDIFLTHISISLYVCSICKDFSIRQGTWPLQPKVPVEKQLSPLFFSAREDFVWQARPLSCVRGDDGKAS